MAAWNLSQAAKSTVDSEKGKAQPIGVPEIIDYRDEAPQCHGLDSNVVFLSALGGM